MITTQYNKSNGSSPKDPIRRDLSGCCVNETCMHRALVVRVVLYCNPLGDATQYNNTTRNIQHYNKADCTNILARVLIKERR